MMKDCRTNTLYVCTYVAIMYVKKNSDDVYIGTIHILRLPLLDTSRY